MISRVAQDVAAYLDLLSEPERRELSALRALIRARLSGAQESVTYGMPYYADRSGAMLCAFAAQKNNLAFYTCDTALLEPFRAALPKSSLGKGCLRFRRLDALPVGMIEAILDGVARKAT